MVHFINKLSGKKNAITGDRPGVTRGKQWIRLQNGFELLDTPGILWPKFEDPKVGEVLAFTGGNKGRGFRYVRRLPLSFLHFYVTLTTRLHLKCGTK